MNGRERYFKIINFEKKRAYRSHGPLVRGRTFFAGGSWDAGSNPPVATSGFFFLSSFFYPLAFYFLFSLLTLLASRDFCENVFLVIDCCHWNWLSVYRLTTPGTSRNVSYRFEGSMTFTQMSSFPSLERFAEAGSSILRRRVQTLLGLQCTLTKPLTVSAWKTPALGFAK